MRAQHILNAGIRSIVYVEAYPDQASEELLRQQGVEIRRFSGVRSSAYLRFFGRWREHAEQISALPVPVAIR